MLAKLLLTIQKDKLYLQLIKIASKLHHNDCYNI